MTQTKTRDSLTDWFSRANTFSQIPGIALSAPRNDKTCATNIKFNTLEGCHLHNVHNQHHKSKIEVLHHVT